jgi:tetratricopeptide (TPR) repeat protein
MGIDDDIAAQLPEPPPPAPARRQATIDQALRRFDAMHHGGPAAAEPARAPRAPWFAAIGRPQAAALVTAGLVALFGIPAAWMSVSHRSAPIGQEQLASRSESVTMADRVAPAPSVEPSPGEPSPALKAPPTIAAPPAIVAAPIVAPAVPVMQNQPRQELASAAAIDEARVAAARPPAMQLARADALRSSDAEGRVSPARPGYGSASRKAVQFADAAPPPPAPPPPPPAMAVAAEAANPAPSDVQVTAQRRAESLTSVPLSIAGGARRSRKAADRGDWNACTINDPDHSLRNCRRLIDPAAAGAKGQASARVADGLSRAWQGDLDGAITAFDQAIATNPRDATAYLNRGLALQRKGEFARAAADLDRAVRYAPGAARGYYNRGQLLRQRGEADRAAADDDRAVALDPAYVAVVE